MSIYIFLGMVVFFVGIIMISYFGFLKVDFGSDLIMLIIIVVILGGIFILGGKGGVLGIVLVVVVIGIMRFGFFMNGLLN